MAYGALTTIAAKGLASRFGGAGLEVLCGHGAAGVEPPDQLGKLKVWFGSKYAARAILADLDIVVVESATDRAIALVEIEETTCKPKVLLGDALAALLGSSVTFQGKRHLKVGHWTRLIILARSANPAQQARIAFLSEWVNHIKAGLDTPNAAVGRIIFRTFQNEAALMGELEQLVREAIEAAARG
jgi:hypothetical protein